MFNNFSVILKLKITTTLKYKCSISNLFFWIFSFQKIIDKTILKIITTANKKFIFHAVKENLKYLILYDFRKLRKNFIRKFIAVDQACQKVCRRFAK